MRSQRTFLPAALALAAILAGALAAPPAADAQRARRRESRPVTHFDDWGVFDDYNRTLLQMQRESISSQEERAREAGRAVRREEVEQQRQQSSAEHEEYFDAILDSSLAALRAPRGAYYRRPGHVSAEPPAAGAQQVDVGGVHYWYDQGVFWLQQGTQYLVVTAPFGATVGALPPAAYRIPGTQTPLWYSFGTFYAPKGESWEVVRPPAGTAVIYLPDGYTQATSGQVTLYRFGEIVFKPAFVQGVLVYQVTNP